MFRLKKHPGVLHLSSSILTSFADILYSAGGGDKYQ